MNDWFRLAVRRSTFLNMPKGCAFCPRCEAAMKICLDEVPQEIRMSDTHLARCWMNVKKMYEAQEENKNE